MSGVAHRMGVFQQLAQDLGDTASEDARVALAVDAATSLVERCSHAGFTVNENGGLSTLVSTDEVVRRANELQQELREGPCLDVMRDQDMIVSTNLEQERRWPIWAPRVHDELEVDSMVSVLVYAGAQSFGAVSLYADRGQRFDTDDVAIAQTLAHHLAMAMTSGREIDQLGRALDSRTVIGHAQGILMERLDIDAAQAFDYLRRMSSVSNRKLVDVAEEVTRTRELPSGEAEPPGTGTSG